MSIKKERVPAIEYMRGISMLGVVGIHVGSQYLMNNPTPNLQLLALYEIVTRFSVPIFFFISAFGLFYNCLLYTSDAADDSLRVDLGGRRIIKKKNFFKQKTAYEISACLVGSEMCIRDRIKGFAEADPTADVEGIDAANKLSILMTLCSVSYTHLTLPTTPYV